MSNSLFTELKRRNVFRVAAAYLAGSWLVVEVAGTLLGTFGFDESTLRFVIIALVIGLIPALVFSWIFELTSDGLKKESELDRKHSISQKTGKKLDHAFLILMAMALSYFAFDKFILAPERDAQLVQTTTKEVKQEILQESYSNHSIAVLPFSDMSAAGNQEYFGDGIAEELLNLLAKIRQLRVIARTSSFSFKGTKDTITEIGAKLNVAYVLEGSVRKAGNKLRITAQLIETATDEHVWSETYTRETDDIFVIQDEIAAIVVDKLKISLRGEMPSLQTVDVEAYDLYLQAIALKNDNSEDAQKRAKNLIHQVLEISPDYAPAIYLQTWFIDQNDAENVEELSRLANEALAKDPDYAPAEAMLGNIAVSVNDLKAAVKHVNRALALDAANPDVLFSAAGVTNTLGRPTEYIKIVEYTIARNPTEGYLAYDLGQAYWLGRRYDDAIESASKYKILFDDPSLVKLLNWVITASLVSKGEYKEALVYVNQTPDPSTPESVRLINLVSVYHGLGDSEQSEAYLKQMLDTQDSFTNYAVASAYALQAKTDLAFEYLDKSIAENSIGLQGLQSNPMLSNLYDDPRWLETLIKIGKDPEKLAAIEFVVDLPE
ncbi:MAG: adenylate cyclase [Enterobacterales bacterium]|jgi:adenylate cyclase